MIGTVRTLDPKMREMIIRRMTEMAGTIAKAYGGEAEVKFESFTSVTYNDPVLVKQMLPSIKKAAGNDKVHIMKATTGGEDFSYFQEKVPGFYFFLGGMAPDTTEAFPHHTPDFKIDDSGLKLGVQSFVNLI